MIAPLRRLSPSGFLAEVAAWLQLTNDARLSMDPNGETCRISNGAGAASDFCRMMALANKAGFGNDWRAFLSSKGPN